MPYPLPVPKRRGLREDSAKDGGDAENEECGEAHGALPRLAVAIVWWAMEGKYTYLRTYLLTHLLTNSLVYCTNGLQSAPASVPGGYRELVSPTEAVLGMGPEPCKPLSLAIGHRHALYKGGSNSHRCPPRLMGRLGGSCVLRLGRNRILCLCLLHRRTLGRVHHLLLGRLLKVAAFSATCLAAGAACLVACLAAIAVADLLVLFRKILEILERAEFVLCRAKTLWS